LAYTYQTVLFKTTRHFVIPQQSGGIPLIWVKINVMKGFFGLPQNDKMWALLQENKFIRIFNINLKTTLKT
jgi:hypothetical protein